MKYGEKLEEWLEKNDKNLWDYAHGQCCDDGDTNPAEFFEMGCDFAQCNMNEEDEVFQVYDGETWYFFAGESEEEIIAGWKDSKE